MLTSAVGVAPGDLLRDNRAGPLPVRMAGDRPSTTCLALLKDVQQRHDCFHRRDLHLAHLLPLVSSRPSARAGMRG